jgi:hypothetical protein
MAKIIRTINFKKPQAHYSRQVDFSIISLGFISTVETILRYALKNQRAYIDKTFLFSADHACLMF